MENLDPATGPFQGMFSQIKNEAMSELLVAEARFLSVNGWQPLVPACAGAPIFWRDPTDKNVQRRQDIAVTTQRERTESVQHNVGVCDRIIRDQAYATTGNITTNLWTARLLDWLHSPERKIAESNLHEQGLYCDPVSPDPLLISMEVLKTYTKVFELEVWFRGLQALMKNSGSLSLETPEVKALFMGTGGRALMTFSNQANDSITLITDESRETPCMGIQGIDSTEEIAKALILNVIIAWNDHDVSIG